MTNAHTIRSILFLLLIPAAFGQSPKKKIVVAGLDDSAFAELRKTAPANVRLVAPQPEQLAADLGNADALIIPKITREVLQGASN